jgi:ribosomal protein S18 acetylase RimI-like enzyme
MNTKQGLYKKQGLTRTELAEIEQLATVCNQHEGLDLKLNWSILRSRPQNETSDFLYYEDDRLIGFLPLFSFNPSVAEVSGMVHPNYRRKGVFTALFNAARIECNSRNIPKMLLIVEHTALSGKAFAGSLGAQYSFSEYKMALEEVKVPPSFNEHLHLRQAESGDASILKHITAVSFGMQEEDIHWYDSDVLHDAARRIYIASLDETAIGSIEVSFNEHEAVISGFGVLPEYRGRGYGRQILARTIQEIIAAGQTHIVLEVAPENKNALSLYHSCGFKETSIYDYFSKET